MQTLLSCPCCKYALSVNETRLVCEKCKKEWNYCDGIPDFLEHQGHWEILEEKGMKLLLDTAKKESCENALKKILLPKTSQMIYQYYTDPKHYEYLKLLPPINNATVLDFGCSLGNITIGLAQKYDNVTAVDTSKYSLEFLKIWSDQKKINNIYPVIIDPVEYSALPFLDNSFDIINFNLVLQWIGVQNTKVSPEKSQIFCLNELYRVLKPGGLIYVGEINRYYYNFFLGEKDSSTVPYASIVPRMISNLLAYFYHKTKVKDSKEYMYVYAKESYKLSGPKYRNYKYSLKGIKKLMSKSGFKNINLFIPLPNPKFPQYFLKPDDKNVNYYMREIFSKIIKKEKNIMKKLIIRLLFWMVGKLNLYKHFVHGFSIIAQK